MIIDLTTTAKEELKKVIETKQSTKPLRIYIASYGWGGPTFGIALDEQKEEDVTLEIDNFKFVIVEELAEGFSKFKVDYSDDWLKRGFSVTPTMA